MCIFAGIIVFSYPYVSNWIQEKKMQEQIEYYNQNMNEREWEQELYLAEEYNKRLAEKGIRFYDAFTEKDSSEGKEYWSLLNMDDTGIMGYISIPAISVELPIYHGTDDEILEKGCGHQAGSSLPVGGATTHAVICGHTGMAEAEIFTNLDQLKLGDEFVITILGRVLTYQIDQIKMVLPEETEDLVLAEGKDYVTLITCTPYGVNTHRLLVRGSRVL